TILALSGVAAEAQDALQSALSIANIIQSKRTDKPIVSDNVRYLGPILYGAGLYSSVEYQDNGTYVPQNRKPETIITAGLTLAGAWPITVNSQLRLGAGLGYARYLSDTQNSGLDILPDSNLAWEIGFDDGSVTFYDHFSYSRKVVTESA